jgi:hypothetical protein
MLVPEAAMDEDGGLVPGQDHVRPPGEVAAVQAEAKLHAMEGPPNGDLWRGVPCLDRRHPAAPLLRIQGPLLTK